MPGSQFRLLALLLVVAAVLVVVGLMSGLSTNLESEPVAGQAATTVTCGSPWVPDYVEAQRVDEQRHLGSALVDACRDHDEGEGLLADATTPAGIVLLLTALGVIVGEVRYDRRRAASSTGVSIRVSR